MRHWRQEPDGFRENEDSPRKEAALQDQIQLVETTNRVRFTAIRILARVDGLAGTSHTLDGPARILNLLLISSMIVC
jgi:hypothetical protein